MNGLTRRLITLTLALGTLLLLLVACDPGGRLDQLTPQPPASSPIIIGITAEAPGGGTLATAQSQVPDAGPQPPTAVPVPTYDPALPAWTILYYAGADNGRAPFIWSDVNEMEAAGPTDQVRVVAQIDWPVDGPTGSAEAARYLIRPDSDKDQSASEVIATLGEVNMGNPTVLADFLTWGVTQYPANRYALFLGDFGGGWQGCCFDESIGTEGQNDHLSLPDIDQALALAQGQTGGKRLEIIGFTASFMNQVDVLQTIQPYAAYVVASAGTVPGSSWDFEPVLIQLNADPLIDGRRFAGDLVTAFVNYQRQLAGDEYSGMAAVDLAQAPALSAAVESLALALNADPGLNGAIAADARRGAQKYGESIITDKQRIAAVDLLHAAAIIGETTAPGELQTSASAVTSAVTAALVAYDHGLGIPNGRGIAIYWPPSTTAYDPLYSQVSRLPSWAEFIAATSPEPPYPTQVQVDNGPRQTINITNPALIRSRIVGHRLAEVALIADQEAADGRRVLRQYEIVQPAAATLPAGTSVSRWADGRHESLIVWDATAGFLVDSTGVGDFAVLWPADFSSIGRQLSAAGWFRRGGSEARTEAVAVFTDNDPAARRLWLVPTVSSGARLLGEVPPAAGDIFEIATIINSTDASVAYEPGVALTFDEAQAIYRTTRPLPAGNFAVGIRANSAEQPSALVSQSLVVDPAGAVPGYRAFVDVAHDAQFLYPADWLPPTVQDGIAYTNNISNTAQLQVRYYPNWTQSLDELQSEVLGTFGEVSVLLQEEVQVSAESPVTATRTAYGYDSAERGPRTGMILTFVKDSVGYVIDLDGPREAEATTLGTMDTMAATWQFLPERLGFGPEPVATLNVSDFRMQYPAGYAYQEFNNWHRFAADPQTFVAVRIQPAGRTPAEAMSGLLQTAAEGVTGFTADEPRRLFYAGHIWERNDFHYTDANGNVVAGLLLSRQDDSSEIAVWAEGPDPADDLIQTIFLPAAATIERIPTAPSG